MSALLDRHDVNADHGRVKILIVEDDPVAVESYRQMVEFLDYELSGVAATGEEAIAAVRETLPDLILMDIYLKDGSSGIETAEKIQKIHDVAIIFVTVETDKKAFHSAQKAEAYGYLVKPINRYELQATIEITLGRHELYRALHQRERNYREFLQNFRGISFECRTDFIPTFIYGLVESMTGYKEEEFTSGKILFSRVIHADDLPVFLEDKEQLATQAGYSVDRELRLIRKDGFYRWLRGGLHNICDATGKPEFIQGFFIDITDQKMVEEAMRQSERRFRELYDYAPVGYHELDTNGMIVRINQTELRLLGYRLDEMLGKPIWSFASDESFAKEMILNQLSGATMGEQQQEVVFRRKDGSTIPIRMVDKIQYGDKKNILGIRSIMEDISEKKRLEEERQQLDLHRQQVQKWKSLSVMAGNIAHDFNNILTGIMGYTNLAQKRVPADSPVSSFLSKIETEVLRASELSKQMLTYSGKGIFEIKMLNISRLVQEMSPLIQSSITKKAQLVLELEDEVPPIIGDGSQIRHAVMHLVSNASDALMEMSGKITIRTGHVQADKNFFKETYLQEDLPEGGYVFLCVEDEGTGMDSETMRRIFDPFFSTKNIGHGLGLAATLGVVRAHKGAIRVQSIPRKGSSISLFFPEAFVEKIPGKETHKPETPSPGKILLVDDEETILDVTSEILQHEGFQVISAKDGTEGVQSFQQNAEDISLVLLDLMMPGLNGEEALAEMRKIRPDIYVILSSGLSEQEARKGFPDVSHLGFIQKPYTLDQLITRVKSVFQSLPHGSEK